MRKALKIKDDDELMDKAMKEDLKTAGYRAEEIAAMNQEELEASDEDSVERRKRKAIKEAKKAAGLSTKDEKPKRISKKEKAHQAYKAER